MRQTGGTAVGATSTRSRPFSCARASASCVAMTPSCCPSSSMTRTSRIRIISLTRRSLALFYLSLTNRPPADTDGWPSSTRKRRATIPEQAFAVNETRLVRRGRRHRSGTDRLTYLDEVAVGVADVGPDLATVILGFGEELRALGGPFGVGLVNVRHAHVHEGARPIRVRWSRQSDRRLVVSGATALVENQPCVGDAHNDRVTLDE